MRSDVQTRRARDELADGEGDDGVPLGQRHLRRRLAAAEQVDRDRDREGGAQDAAEEGDGLEPR